MRTVIVAVFILRCDSLRRRGGMIVPAILSLTGHRRLHRHASGMVSGMVSVGGQGMMRHAALEPRHSRNALQREGDDE